jgi:hypothetical protein
MAGRHIVGFIEATDEGATDPRATHCRSTILWSLGMFCGHSVYFSCFGMFHQEKCGNPAVKWNERSFFRDLKNQRKPG